LLAKAVAAEANVPFFNMAGTEFIEMIGGVGNPYYLIYIFIIYKHMYNNYMFIRRCRQG
jgi:hypothetical protein